MKILLCSEFYYPKIGGVERHNEILANFLHKKKNFVEIATSSSHKKNQKYFPYKINYFNITGSIFKGYFGETIAYQNFLIESKFDIIFFNAAQQWSFDLALPIIEEIKSKKILFPCGFSRLNNILYKPYFLILQKKFKYFDKIICVNRNLQDFKFISKFYKKKIYIVNNGASFIKNNFKLNKKKFLQNYNLANETKIIIYLSNFKFFKGQDIAINIYKKLKIKNAILLLIGNSQNLTYMMYLYFMKIILKIFYQKKIIIISNKNYNYSQSMLKISDLFLFTSRTEYDPLVIYEAIINKKKIISLDTGNIKNILINNKNAFVSNNKKLIVSKIYEFLFSRYHYFNYKKFLWVNIMKKYYNIFLKT
jgi:glycosyltransferase involved in cell wall biosynthesis